MREFKIAAKRADEQDEKYGPDVPMKMDDGRVITFFHPSPTQLALLTGLSQRANVAQQAAVVVDLLVNIVSEDDGNYLVNRLMDRKDKLEIENFFPTLIDMVEEEWVGRPTKQPSDYLPPQSSTGESSTAKRKKTSSRSRQTAS